MVMAKPLGTAQAGSRRFSNPMPMSKGLSR